MASHIDSGKKSSSKPSVKVGAKGTRHQEKLAGALRRNLLRRKQGALPPAKTQEDA